jgi:hypothetical protein
VWRPIPLKDAGLDMVLCSSIIMVPNFYKIDEKIAR